MPSAKIEMIEMYLQVFLTPTHLGIVLQYAAGGELFERVKLAGNFTEDEARYFFQQLITGVRYCHRKNFAHRDLKLENTLLDASPAPLLKIADFGYCKDLVFDTPPKSTVGTPAYISPVCFYLQLCVPANARCCLLNINIHLACFIDMYHSL